MFIDLELVDDETTTETKENYITLESAYNIRNETIKVLTEKEITFSFSQVDFRHIDGSIKIEFTIHNLTGDNGASRVLAMDLGFTKAVTRNKYEYAELIILAK